MATRPPRRARRSTLPAGVVAGFGGLSVELASTAMVGLGEGARYLIEYPYGCAEQRSSRALALLLAADLGDAFALPDIDAKDARTIPQAQLTQLRRSTSAAAAASPTGRVRAPRCRRT